MIEEVEKTPGKRGRDIVSYSGTEHMCRLTVESFTREETEKYCRQIAEVVEEN